MRQITVSGSLPATINEHVPAGGWTGQLSATGELDGLIAIETIGPQAMAFAAGFDPLTGIITVTTVAQLSYAGFILAGQAPEADFSLRFEFSDATYQDAPATYAINVQPVHDAPPLGLSLSSGGSVAAGAIGAPIGILAVLDPSWDGPFSFSFGSADDWRFTVTGNLLALAPGVSLGLDDQGTLPLTIDVSDGRYHAAFTLPITVLPPQGPVPIVHVLGAGEDQSGFYLSDAVTAASFRAVAEVQSVTSYAGGYRQLSLRDGGTVWLPPTQELHFADGWLDFNGQGWVAQVTTLYHTVLNREPDPNGLTFNVGLLKGGLSAVDLATAYLNGPEYQSRIGQVSDTAFLTDLYHTALGRAPDAAGLTTHLAELAGGTLSRAELTVAIAFSPEAFALLDAQHPGGFWSPITYGREVAMVYSVGLGRLADPAGYTNWTSKLQSGALHLSDLAGQIGGSQEFLGRYGSVDDTTFVTGIYHDALGRAPDAPGLAHWVGLLASHAISRSDLVGSFAFSQEEYGHYQQAPTGLDVPIH